MGKVSEWVGAKTVFGILIVVAVVVALVHSGSFLVVNRPVRSDVIVVLGGDHNDVRYWRGLELLRQDYGRQLIVDATSEIVYGRSYADYARDYIARSANDIKSHVSVCVITVDSTVQESSELRSCLAQINPAPRSILLVSSEFHTRRALSILHARLPQYSWSAAAAFDTDRFGVKWWQHREWAKTFVYEWEKFIWWKLFESWRR